MKRFAAELEAHGLEVRLELKPSKQANLNVMHGEEIDFRYSITARLHSKPDDAMTGDDDDDESSYYRAEVHLNDSGQDYDVMGWTKDQVLHDILEQYEKHLHVLR